MLDAAAPRASASCASCVATTGTDKVESSLSAIAASWERDPMRYSASGCDLSSPNEALSQTDRDTQSRDAVVVAVFIAPLQVSSTDSEAESCPSMHTAIVR